MRKRTLTPIHPGEGLLEDFPEPLGIYPRPATLTRVRLQRQ